MTYRRYLFSYSFEVFTPIPEPELVPTYEVISNANYDQILFSLARLLLFEAEGRKTNRTALT